MDAKGPLAGVKVLDFTHVLAGSYGTMLLGDMGADIIKVERKGIGDALRKTPPLKNGESAYFFCSNRNKRGLSLDLKKEGAVELVRRLVKNCDVFAENFRPGVMERLGLGYADIKKVKPDIIYASLTAFGEKGHYRDKPGFELIIQSLVGLVSVTSEPDGRPAKVQPQVVDICGGMFIAIAILGALYHRKQTGQGQRITTSLMEGLFALMTNFVYMHLMGSKIPHGLRTRNPMMFPSQSFKTQDAHISTVVVPAHWERFCNALGKPEWINHPDYSNVVYRVQNYDAMEALVEQVTTNKSTADWLEIFEQHQVAAAPINKVEEFFEDPQFSVLNLLTPLDHSKAGKVQIQTPPWQMSETPCDVKLPPPALGEHSIQILRENGFDNAEIETLLKEGLIETG
ncbi:MAG: CoA transferase [Deltaproteobacteria bacterium]|nr:MAG: CoA transferase [Deltaproteobacteria bacterium]